MKNTIFVNFIAAPGHGKSTMTANLFAELKWRGIDCEMVSEFAKELVWEERNQTFKDELYLLAKQNHRLFRVNGKVDVVITDRPIILSILYNRLYSDKSKTFDSMVYETHSKYRNINYFLNRIKKYNPNGRNQTQEESDKMNVKIKDILEEYKIPFTIVDGGKEQVSKIADEIEVILNTVI